MRLKRVLIASGTFALIAPVGAAYKSFPGQYTASQVGAAVRENSGCRLPDVAEMTAWAGEGRSAASTASLYWLAPASPAEAAYPRYFYLPRQEPREFGSLQFDAALVLMCPETGSTEQRKTP